MKHTIFAFVAGKSGGHILPCLYIAHQKKKTDPTTQIIFFTTRLALDKKIIDLDTNVSLHIAVALQALPRGIAEYPIFLWNILSSFAKSFITFIDHRPSQLITTGGIVAIPTVLAAWLLRIPIHIYVLDFKPGKAIRLLAHFASKLSYCFTQTSQFLSSQKAVLCTYPSAYGPEDYTKSPRSARSTLGLDPDKKTLCILGGSQGSLFINDAIVNWIEQSGNMVSTIQIIHQTGSQDTRLWHTIYPRYGIKAYVFDYRQNLANIYAAADLIICRAGAGTLFEIQQFNKKGLIIPLETSHNTHQLDNAYAIVKQCPDQFKMIRQSTIAQEPHVFFKQIEELLNYSALNGTLQKDNMLPTGQ